MILETMDRQLPLKERQSQGIFFTSPAIVERIHGELDIQNAQNIIDSAAGSGNFLVSLARKYPEKQFYAVEKNPEIFRACSREYSSLKNLHIFQGDILLDTFPIPTCDLYMGNPPFINYTDLSAEYREKIRPIWQEYFPENRGFSLLLGTSRGDIAQLIFYHTITRYLKKGGSFGVVLPQSLIRGGDATKGFRSFKGLSVSGIQDISGQNAFSDTRRNSFYIIGKKGGTTAYPVPYTSGKTVHKLYPQGGQLRIQAENSHFSGCSDYRARQGINTLGANSIFFFKDVPPFSSPLIKPLLKSSDISPMKYRTSYHALIPYDKNGKLLEEEVLKSEYPRAFNYLREHKQTLIKRKSRFAQKHWYALFGIGPYTFAPYKVVWKALGASRMEAAVVTGAFPNQAMHCFIPCSEKSEAHYLCAVLNSRIFTENLLTMNSAGAKSFAQPAIINQMGLMKFQPENSIHRALSELSESLHENDDISDTFQKDLDSLIKSLIKP